MSLKEKKLPGRQDVYRVDPNILEIQEGYNVRWIDPKDPKFIQLKESIRANGVKEPLTVKTVTEGGKERYFIRAGHRRLTAVLELVAEGVQIVGVPVRAVKMSEEEETLDLFTSNGGEPLNPIEQGEAFQRFVNYGWGVAKIAKQTGFSGQHVRDCLAAFALPPEVKQRVFDGEISATFALELKKEHGDGDGLKKATAKAVSTAKAEGKTKATAKTGKTKPGLSMENFNAIISALDGVEPLLDLEQDPDAPKVIAALAVYLRKNYTIYETSKD